MNQYPLFFLDGSVSELSEMPKRLVLVLSTGDVRLQMHVPLGRLVVMEPMMGDLRMTSYVPNPGNLVFFFFFLPGILNLFVNPPKR